MAAVMNRDCGRLEGDRTDFDAADDLVLQSLVVDLNVVVGAEIALGVVVHVDVDPPADGAAGADVHLVVEPRRLEAAAAAGVRVQQQRRTAALVSQPVGPKLQSDLAVESEVGILRRQPQHAPPLARGPGASRRDLVPDRLAVQGEIPERGGPLTPGGIEDGA